MTLPQQESDRLGPTRIEPAFQKQRLSLLSVVCVAHAYDEQRQKTDADGQSGSRCSARSDHLIRAKIGTGCECGHVFITRRPTGDPCTRRDAGKHDLTPCRIPRLIPRLNGCEPVLNRLGAVNNMRRRKHIRGRADVASMGIHNQANPDFNAAASTASATSHVSARMRFALISAIHENLDFSTQRRRLVPSVRRSGPRPGR